MPARSSRLLDLSDWLPSPKALLWMLLAFVAGLLLFAAVWLAGREDSPAEPEVPAAAEEDEGYRILPAPLPAQRGGGRIERAPSQPGEARPEARLVETSPPPPPPEPLQPAEPPQPPPAAAGAYVSPQPIPGQTPSPRYPARALRRGDSGTVVVRAEIGADGVPVSVGIERSSGSRALDRAAEDAVRRWRFQPALRDGRPTTGSVVVPISFDPD